jgi:hypothetical protein
MFDLSNITLAFVTAHDAAQSFDAMCADMIQWHQSGVYPTNKELIGALVAANRWGKDTCKTYASNLLAWAKAGQTPRNISQVVKGKPAGHVKGKGGRPTGQGAGKTTAAKPDTAQADKPTVENNDKAWIAFIGEMRAKVTGRKDWRSEDIVAFQDCTMMLLSIIKRNVK